MEEKQRGISNTNIIPRNNLVLIKMELQASIMGIVSESFKGENSKVTCSIAGYGPIVKDLELGQKVLVKLQEYESVKVEGNNKDVESLTAFYKGLSQTELKQAIKDNPKVDVVQYGLFPEYLVNAIIE